MQVVAPGRVSTGGLSGQVGAREMGDDLLRETVIAALRALHEPGARIRAIDVVDHLRHSARSGEVAVVYVPPILRELVRLQDERYVLLVPTARRWSHIHPGTRVIPRVRLFAPLAGKAGESRE